MIQNYPPFSQPTLDTLNPRSFSPVNHSSPSSSCAASLMALLTQELKAELFFGKDRVEKYNEKFMLVVDNLQPSQKREQLIKFKTILTEKLQSSCTYTTDSIHYFHTDLDQEVSYQHIEEYVDTVLAETWIKMFEKDLSRKSFFIKDKIVEYASTFKSIVDTLPVTACNHKSSGLQSRPIWDQIICNYPYPLAHIICNWACNHPA